MSFDPVAVLKECGGREDAQINLFTAAIALAAPSHPGIVADKYFNHMSKIARDVGERYRELVGANAPESALTQLASLSRVIDLMEGYKGDSERYDDLQNADMMRVIDRRRGMPIALGILYMQAGRMNGWTVHGLNFPGHFLCRIDSGAERIIFDPFEGGAIMEAPDLRMLVKRMRGGHAELSADYYAPCSNRETLMRLQNNIKLRLIEAEDYAGALRSVEMMRWFAPEEYRLFLDTGVLQARLGRRDEAIAALEEYIMRAPDPRDRQDAQMMIRELRTMPPG